MQPKIRSEVWSGPGREADHFLGAWLSAGATACSLIRSPVSGQCDTTIRANGRLRSASLPGRACSFDLLSCLFREHLATVRGNDNLVSVLLRWLDFASFEGFYSPEIEGLVFCRAGAILFKFR
jgi:hypothetical protein